MISKIEERIEILYQLLGDGQLHPKRELSKLFGICKDNSTIETALAELTFKIPDLYETDKGKLGLISLRRRESI